LSAADTAIAVACSVGMVHLRRPSTLSVTIDESPAVKEVPVNSATTLCNARMLTFASQSLTMSIEVSQLALRPVQDECGMSSSATCLHFERIVLRRECPFRPRCDKRCQAYLLSLSTTLTTNLINCGHLSPLGNTHC
jgi:hypothetical protein